MWALHLHGVASEAGVELVDEGEHDDGVQARILHERQLRLHAWPTRHGNDKPQKQHGSFGAHSKVKG